MGLIKRTINFIVRKRMVVQRVIDPIIICLIVLLSITMRTDMGKEYPNAVQTIFAGLLILCVAINLITKKEQGYEKATNRSDGFGG